MTAIQATLITHKQGLHDRKEILKDISKMRVEDELKRKEILAFSKGLELFNQTRKYFIHGTWYSKDGQWLIRTKVNKPENTRELSSKPLALNDEFIEELHLQITALTGFVDDLWVDLRDGNVKLGKLPSL